jgi:Fe2+ or Zn2+ uptake regulation protein
MGPDFQQILRGLHLKSTPKRIALLEILDRERVYPSPEGIWKKMKKKFPGIGLPTVYRNLEELHEGGIISRVIHPNRKLYYYLCRNGEHHHHFICISCRKVEDVNFCAAKDIEKIVSGDIKGKVLSHILQINGLCSSCLYLEGAAAHEH